MHFEPFLQLADVGDDEALIAWGGFYFGRGDSPYGEWRIVDDEELAEIAGGGRSGTIGASSEPFGEAVVEVELEGEVVGRAHTAERNHAWVHGLEPETDYRYRVLVDGEPWAHGERWEWDFERGTLVQSGRRYENAFRTLPAADEPARLVFAALGDFGVGIFDRGEDGAPPAPPRPRPRARSSLPWRDPRPHHWGQRVHRARRHASRYRK